MTYEKYEEVLDKLVDNKDIVSYEDNCKDNIDYTIKFTRSELSKLDDVSLNKLLKLEESSTEIYTTLDEFGKLKIFNSTPEIIEYFVNFRLKYYNIRKQFLLDKMNRELKLFSNRGRFIKSILDGKLKINNVPKLEIIESIELLKLEKAIQQQGEDTKRKSNSNKDDFNGTTTPLSDELKEYLNSIEILNRQSLPLQPNFNNKVQHYFKHND